MSTGSSPPSKNRKTFSGCWSCRERKIKCDEARPSCGQCKKSGLECKGYGIRLQWIVNQQLDPGFPGLTNPRRNVVPDCHMPVLSWGKIDQILSTIGQHDPRHRPDSQENVQLSMACFGVFRGVEYETNQFHSHQEPDSPGIQVQHATHDSPSPAIEQTAEGASFVYPIHPLHSPTSENEQASLSNYTTRLPSISSLSVNNQGPVPSSNRIEKSHDALDNYETDWNSTPVQITDDRNTPHHLLRGPDASGSSPSLFSERRSISDTPSHIHILDLPLSPTLDYPESCYLGKKEKFLMNYYTKRVVDLFCVIENGTSPWKTIHLPKVLNAVGEISVSGTTSRIREALISSCLSISAFCLSNDCRLRQREDECLKWGKLAYDYRLKAIKLLRNAMEKDFSPKIRVKYKDFLTTTLSMITIDVMSGETDTCGIHLDGALRLIRHGQTWKRQYSNKAQCLHRIYFYLRTIFESTLPRDSQTRRRHRQLSSPVEQDTNSQDVFCHDIVAKYSSWSSPSILDRNPDPNIGSYESIYGVPYSLLFLLTKIIDLTYKLYDESFDGRIPFDLMDECDDLEHSIMDWPSHTNFPSQPLPTQSSSAKIVHHHTVAFHNALIIYFAQHIRLVGHRFLQPHIRAVLDSMEVIEQIKVETNLVAAPLYWPAFIAGSEAFDEALQARFRLWYEHVRFYGLEALRTGISVLEEVWEAGPRRKGRVTSLWRDLVERSGQILMLS